MKLTPVTPAHRLAIADRRQRVADLMLSGVRNHSEIAEQVGVARSTVSRDVAWLEAEFRERAASLIETEKGLDLARADELIAGLWPAAVAGKWLAVDRVIHLLEYRANILGLNAPQRRQSELSGPNGSAIEINAANVTRARERLLARLEAMTIDAPTNEPVAALPAPADAPAEAN